MTLPGHFTTMQVRERRIQGLGLHVERLVHATSAMHGSRLDEQWVRTAMGQALRQCGVSDATLRICVEAATRGDAMGPSDAQPVHAASASRAGATSSAIGEVVIHANASANTGAAVIWLRARVAAPMVHPASPMRLQALRYAREMPHIKHTGNADSFAHRDAALAAGFDDALYVDAAQRVLEGTFWNIGFWDASGIVWPDAPALRGTGERLLQAALAAAGVEQVVRPVVLAELDRFDGAFIINARGLRGVASIDDQRWADPCRDRLAMLKALLAAVPWDPIDAA